MFVKQKKVTIQQSISNKLQIMFLKKDKKKESNKKKTKNDEVTLFFSSLLSEFSKNNLINPSFKPRILIDLKRLVKFLKFPVNAIPLGPKNSEITRTEKIPNTN